jgi:phosphopantothenoylcysteine decarboxylase / phosphopantothenate---cysteine ligase
VIKDTGVERKSHALDGKRIAFGVCGGIGAVETVKLMRELRRHGAELTTFLTPSATRFITELSLAWASQGPVIREAGADVDHLDNYDLAVIAPLTLNTLSKFALGITDSAVALMVAGQLGRRGKVAVVPAMNAQLQSHPLYGTYRALLEKWGVVFFASPEEEGRLKMPDPEKFSQWLIEVSK